MFDRLIKRILRAEGKRGKVDLALVDDRRIRRLNRAFRKKDRPTDVLAFPYDEGGVLGDVIISKDTTRRNAGRYGVSYRAELKRLAIHGVLHILGYDHGRKMSHAEKIYTQF